MVHRQIYRRISRFLVHRILHTDDSPSRIARGVAIGVFVAWLPLIGLQMLIALGLSFIFRANKLVGLSVVWISNVFTLVPIYYPSYRLGSALLGTDAVGTEAFTHEFTEIYYSSEPWASRLKELADLLFEGILYPTFIGSLVLGFLLAIVAYFLTIKAVKRYRARRITHRGQLTAKESDSIPFHPPPDMPEEDPAQPVEQSQSKVG